MEKARKDNFQQLSESDVKQAKIVFSRFTLNLHISSFIPSSACHARLLSKKTYITEKVQSSHRNHVLTSHIINLKSKPRGKKIRPDS